MFQSFGSLFGRPAPQKKGLLMQEPSTRAPISPRGPGDSKMAFTKVFRWRLPDGQTEEPSAVEIVGSFTHWHKVPLTRDGKLDSWHVILHHIQGNRTHHYMLLVNGMPTYDKNCDGLVAPHGFQEEQFQLKTDKGPRVLMLFAQTK
jgi:hypothetical protein